MSSISSSSGTTGSSFKIGGLVSGLDTESIVSKLMDIEKKPLETLNTKKANVTNQLTAWRDLNTRLQALSTAVQPITWNTTFQARTVTSSNTGILTATATAGTNNATQTVSVEQLAQSHMIASQTYSSQTASIGTGTVSIQIGSGTAKEITVDSSNSTLSGLKDTINKGDYGVSANIAQVATGQYQLVLTSKTSGEDGAITFTPNLSGGTAPSFSTIQAAQNSKIKLGSSTGGGTPLEITSSSNTITGVIEGVTLNLVSADPGKTVTVSLNTDTSNARKSIDGFISQFNNMVDYFSDQFYYDADSGETGTLFSNTDLMMVKNDLYNALQDNISGSGKYKNLAELGVTIDESGKLAVTDEDALSSALSDNLDDVRSFFTSSTGGFGTRMNDIVNNLTDPFTGVLKTTDNYFTDLIKDISEQITAKNDYLARVEENYNLKFTQLETALSKLQSQSNSVLAQLNAMTSNSSSSS